MRVRIAVGLAVLLFVGSCVGEPVETSISAPVGSTQVASSTTLTGSLAGSATTAAELGTRASLIFTGGPVFTMDESLSVAEGLAVAGNGIIAVGSHEEVAALAGSETVHVDLAGRALLPGFVDAHAHYYGRDDPLAVQDRMLSAGVTAVGEMGVSPELLDELMHLDGEGRIRPRTSVYLLHNDSCGVDAQNPITDIPATRGRGERLRIGGVKIFTDGGACNAPAVSYEHAFGGNGDLYYDVEGLTQLVSSYDVAGYQTAIHAIGDRAIDVVLQTFEQVVGESGNPLRHRIEHNAVVPPEMRDRYDAAGAVAVIFGEFGACALAGLDPRFKFTAVEPDWEWPWRDLIDLNPSTVFAWHGDFPVFEHSTPLASLYGFVTRRQVLSDGTECDPSPYHETQVIAVEEALGLMTNGAAYALDRDTEIGSLEVGKLADLVVLSDDPTTIDPVDLLGLSVDLTVLDGEPVFCSGELIDLCRDGAQEAVGRVTATASATDDLNPPSNAIDGDPGTHWSAGELAPQWIEIDLGGTLQVSSINLIPAQDQPGFTSHRILGRGIDGELFLIEELAGETEGTEAFEVTADRPWTVMAIRIETDQSPGLVGWTEVTVTTNDAA